MTASVASIRRSAAVVALATSAVVAVWLTAPPMVNAECPWFPVPSATNAARSAEEIIVGTVIENIGDSPEDFRLRIDHVLRGPDRPGDVRRFRSLYPRWPLARGANGELYPPCAPIPAWKGDVIAFSLHATAPDEKTTYHGASWISGYIPPYRRDDLPRTTLEQMRALAALPRTDTSAAAPAVGGAAIDIYVFYLLTAVLGAFAMTRRTRPVRSAHRAR